MTNASTFGQRTLSAVLAGATILWAVGIASLAVPQAAHAASPGDRIKSSSLSAVYFYGYDGTRSTYPNLKTYETWHNGFDGVKTVSDSELSSLQLSGNVVYRPGSRWIKVDTAYETYAVSTNGSIHWIETEDVAVGYDGASWNTNIDDVPDTFFVDYNVGASLMAATAFDGMMYMDGTDHYVAWGGEKRLVSAAGMSANAMDSDFFLQGAGIDDLALTAGADVTALVCDLVDASQTGCTTAVTPVAGSLTVSASSSTPAGATLPGGANSVEVFSFNVQAGSDATVLNSVTASMVGVGTTANVTAAYLYDGNTRLTDARTVNSSTRQITFGSLALSLAAGQSKTLTVRIEVASTQVVGDQIVFAIDSASAVSSTGTVAGSFPITGNAFSVASADAGTVTVTKSGSISSPAIGTNDAKIGKFQIAAASEAASLEEITLKVDNAADHSDFKLWDDSVLLATGTYVGKKLVTFDLSASPFAIVDGGSNVFTLTADVGGDAGQVVGVYVDNAADVVATGAKYGFGMLADIGATSGTYNGASLPCSSTSDNCSYTTTQGGDVTMAKVGPAAGSISINSQDQTLLTFNLTASQAITVKDLDILVGGEDNAGNDPFTPGDDSGNDNDGLINTNGEGNVSDIKIVNLDTGLTVMGPLELDCVTTTCGADGTNDGSQTIDFTDDFAMAVGETLHLAVTADIDNNVTSGTEFGATVVISGFSAEDVNGDAISNIVPSGNIAGNAQQALAGSLVVSLASTPGDVVTVDGATGVDVVAFSLVAGSASDLLASSITVAVYADEDGTPVYTLGDVSGADVNDFIASCSLSDLAGNVLAGPKSPEVGGASIIFDNMNWTIPAGASELLTVTCDLNNPSDGTDVNYFAFDITTVASDIVLVDEDGTDVDPTGNAVNGGTTPTNAVTVNAAGSLTVAADASTPSAAFLLTGSTNNLVSTYKLTATIEDWDVTTFSVAEKAAQVMGLGTDATTYTNNISTVTLEYPATDGSTKTKSVAMNSNEAKFSALDMTVKVGSPVKVNAYVNVPASDRDAGGNATSNEMVRLGFFVDGTGNDNFEAVGADSGTRIIDSGTGAPTAVTSGLSSFVVKKTKPTVTLSAASPSGVGFVPGDMEVLRFNVAASTNEDVALDQVVFTMSASDTASVASGWADADTTVVGDFDIYNLNGTSSALDVDGDWKFLVAAGTESTGAAAIKFVKLDLTTPVVVPAGSTYTFALHFDSTGASAATDDSIQFGIAGDALATPIALGTARTVSGAHTATVTTLTGSGALDTTATGAVAVGDILAFAGTERVLVTAYTAAASTATIQRGYMGTTPAALTGGEAITRIPSSFVWEDDGDSSASVTGDIWGSYLVKDLPITGGAMSF